MRRNKNKPKSQARGLPIKRPVTSCPAGSGTTAGPTAAGSVLVTPARPAGAGRTFHSSRSRVLFVCVDHRRKCRSENVPSSGCL